ncbi:MAG: hypothetical protein ABI591_05990 [Kofleriaceae bacterium]
MRWPQLRAGLVAVAIGFGLIDGCPLPDHVPAWERGFVEPIRSVRDVVETPVAWIRRVFAVTQKWSLYQAPVAQRYRMWIEGHAADTWQVLYRAGDAEHAEDAALIEHARVWGTWDPTNEPALEYQQFGRWIAGRMLVAHPELTMVRLRMERIEIGHGEYTPTGEFFWPIQRRRGAP